MISTNFRFCSVLLGLLLASCGQTDLSDSSAANSSNSSVGQSELAATQAASCEDGSWYAGSSLWCRGQLVYRDYVYDDYGADKGAISPHPTLLNLLGRGGKAGNPNANTPSLLAPTAGDIRYPAGAESTADLVKLTLSRNGGQLNIVAQLNALYSKNQTVLGIAIDTDNNESTGDKLLMGLKVKGADVVYTFNEGDPESNQIKAQVPMPTGVSWKIWAVTAQASGEVMNVAFRGMDEQAGATGGIPDQALPGLGNWWEDKQAAALAAGDITSFSQTVAAFDFSASNTSSLTPKTGFYQRVYESKYTAPNSTGEGMTLKGVTGRENRAGQFCGQYFNFVGKYQPYGVYLPATAVADQSAGKASSLQVVLHGCEANHASQINQPNMQKQFGEDLARIIVAPLGRGPYGFYSDLSERDVLDVMADIQSKFKVDEDKVFISGYSMGGYGSSRLAMLFPDRFAGLNNWVGFTGSIVNTPIPGNPLVALEDQFRANGGGALPLDSRIGGVGNIIDYQRNMQHIPGTHSYALADELVQVNTGLAWANALQATGNVLYEFYMHLAAEHLTLIALDEWAKEAEYTKNLKRAANPAAVYFKTNALFDFPEYEIKHDKAYWVSGIEIADTSKDVVIDLKSDGCANPQIQFETGQTVGNGPVPFVQTFRRLVGMSPAVAGNTLSGSVSNLKSAAIDLQATCLNSGMRYDITSDGAGTLRLSNGKAIQLKVGANAGSI